MIESIHIKEVATYGDTPEKMDGLSQFNYVFGSNGTGKTTISKIINNEAAFPSCRVNWKGGTKLEPLVYNEDFVKKNFEQSSELKGVFTLGEKSSDTLKKIANAKNEHDELTKKIENLTSTLEGEDGTGGKKGELDKLEEGLKNTCWEQKRKHDEKLQGAFEGYRNNSKKFKDKVLQESTSNNAELKDLSYLEQKAKTVFDSTPTLEPLIPTIEGDTLLAHETNPILKKRVIGKENVDIAALIKKLNNSDWVRQGRVFYDPETKICPFCQQPTTEAFANSLSDYFDEAYETDIKSIDQLVTDYKTDQDRLLKAIDSIIATKYKFLDIERIKAEKELLSSRLTVNQQRLTEKKKEPSQIVELDSISSTVSSVKKIIDDVNSDIKKHNKTVENLSQERRDLTEQVWKYLLEKELKISISTYKKEKDSLDKAITALSNQIKEAEREKIDKDREIRDLEKQTTSVQPTIDGINAILSSFGFQGFSLKKAEDGISYKLLRSDGSDAKKTLSEGERSFVTFLYFYHLLKGSQSEDGITTDRIVVFDDPVSSLDSEVLFIVSSLIKGLFDEVRGGTGYIKQVFVLTHNVYFHREVTFNVRRTDLAMNEETFWIVRKHMGESKLYKHDSNPIKTSYELLWSEVRNPDRSNFTIQNTLRRILENYFKILGGIDPDRIYDKFEGQDKLICKSLFSWINAGSHFAEDDIYISTDGVSVDSYLRVFRAIFEKTEHAAHYKMMMGDAYEEKTAEEVIAHDN